MSQDQVQEQYKSPLQSGESPDLSFVIPVMNEEATLQELVEGIDANVPEGSHTKSSLLTTGSTDDSWTVIQALADLYPGVVVGVRFRANCGKAAGLQTGFDSARGQIVFTMDADLQDDPNEIPRFLQKLDEGYDLVSGWKQVRHDPWHKVLPSRAFNRMLSYFSGVKLHDHNCGFKCYRPRGGQKRSAIWRTPPNGTVARRDPRIPGHGNFGDAPRPSAWRIEVRDRALYSRLQ